MYTHRPFGGASAAPCTKSSKLALPLTWRQRSMGVNGPSPANRSAENSEGRPKPTLNSVCPGFLPLGSPGKKGTNPSASTFPCWLPVGKDEALGLTLGRELGGFPPCCPNFLVVTV